MNRGVVAPLWLNRPADEALAVADLAERLGASEFWVGEMMHFDAFALAGAVASRTRRVTVTTGPLALGLRDPVGVAMGVASVAVIGGRPSRLALGASSPTVVRQWHGREFGGEAERVGEAISLIRAVLSGSKTDHHGAHYRSSGFRTGLGRQDAHVSVAVAGPRMIAAAAGADRLVTNLASVDWVRVVAEQTGLKLAIWVVAAVEPSPAALDQVRRQIALYLLAPGYRQSLTQAGFGALIDKARDGASTVALAHEIGLDLIGTVAAVGSAAEVEEAIRRYETAGAEVMLVPVTVDDPAGERTLRSQL